MNINDLEAVIIESMQVTLTPSAIIYLTRNKVPLILCNEKHIPEVQCMNIYSHFNITKKILEQIQWHEVSKCILWKQLIKNKITNQLSLLIYSNSNINYINKLQTYITNLEICKTIDDICHVEAISAREYFKGLFGLSFKRQNDDIINASLNYGYSLLRSFICSIIVSKGLHPSLGICHKSQLNNFNLADDIIEIYRPIVDFAVFIKKDYVTELDKNLKKHLLQTVIQKVLIEEKEVNFKRSVRLLIENIEDFFNSREKIKMHLTDSSIYAYE